MYARNTIVIFIYLNVLNTINCDSNVEVNFHVDGNGFHRFVLSQIFIIF